MHVLELRLEPLAPFSLKPPQPFEAGVHGPGSVGSSLSYPMPSTIAGKLAGIAYERNEGCARSDPTVERPYVDQEECLEGLLGEDYRIYTGLLEAGGKRYVYTNTDTFPSLEDLKRIAAAVVGGSQPPEPEDTVKALRSRRFGIALKRESKSVEEGMLYSLELVSYKPPATILGFIIAGKEERLETPTKLGAKTGLARLSLAPASGLEQVSIGEGTYAGVLISPALLDESPFQEGIVWLSPAGKGEEAAKKLAGKLLGSAGVSGEGRVLLVPKGEHELAVQNMGWSIRNNRPRPPMLVLPPGTILELSLREPIPEGRALKLVLDTYLIGLGCCSKLGWGTTLLFPI